VKDSYEALGHVPHRSTSNNFSFFLSHLGAIKVRTQSLMSNVFRILRTAVIKIRFVFHFIEKNEKGISDFFL